LNPRTVSTIAKPRKETPLDKTTRIVRRIKREEAEIREVKTARLRNDRLKSKAGTPVEASAAPSSSAQEKLLAKMNKWG
jgi:hypothetical protein